MAFKKRTSLSGLTGSNWMDWALRRTGVAMPNCFTYATARISEILGREEYLDSPRVNGAQELWDNYSDGFKRSKYAVEGALMIWQSGQWGHVAVCEELIDTNTIAWSQSNYGGAMFEYVKGNPNGYKGMKFLGYLVHDKLPKAEAANHLLVSRLLLALRRAIRSKSSPALKSTLLVRQSPHGLKARHIPYSRYLAVRR